MLPTVALLAAWGLIGTPAPVGWGAWLSRTLPEDAEAGGSLVVATIQLGITLGASVGGLLFALIGYRSTFGASAAMLSASAVLALLSWRLGSKAIVNRPRVSFAAGLGTAATLKIPSAHTRQGDTQMTEMHDVSK
ncbi:hypothetical protein [Falsiroseomonas sp. E2-1-a20]|uniref:hypothetical protein n=1 Tax=Falsiroseomonas sp. E2-1-a20 TaxID=3239300 RepID=UPI003F3C4697